MMLDPQIKNGKGFDHNWALKKQANVFSLAATLKEPTSGRVMEVWTTEPGLQFYSGNFLNGTDIGKGGKRYEYRTAICLEAQHFPDSPNQPNFPFNYAESRARSISKRRCINLSLNNFPQFEYSSFPFILANYLANHGLV
jgi:galactose mutarotase-like enzyme